MKNLKSLLLIASLVPALQGVAQIEEYTLPDGKVVKIDRSVFPDLKYDADNKRLVATYYTGKAVDYSDAEVEYNEGPGQLAVQVTFGNEEYYCYESYDEAEEAAQEDCKELFDDVGIEGIRFENIGGIEQFVDTGWFEDAKKEDAEYYVSDIHESEPERYQEEFGDVDEDEAVEKYLEDYYDGDDVQWYIDNFGKKQFTEIVKQNNLIDLDKLAEAIVDADGPANSLARYDGDEISLDCGYYCYRTN